MNSIQEICDEFGKMTHMTQEEHEHSPTILPKPPCQGMTKQHFYGLLASYKVKIFMESILQQLEHSDLWESGDCVHHKIVLVHNPPPPSAVPTARVAATFCRAVAFPVGTLSEGT